MNLTNFLNQTDLLTENYSAEQLRIFIHDIARVIPESKRPEILHRLIQVANAEKIDQEKKELDMCSKILSEYDTIMNNFDLIEAEDVTIYSELNEEYDDWYGGEEFFYEDRDHIGVMLKKACDFIRTCLDLEEYKEGYEIGERLFELRILCESEYGEVDFSVDDMVRHDFLHVDLRTVALDTLYCCYQAVSMNDRPCTLYILMTLIENKDITLESLMQHGDHELPDFKTFLDIWIEYLGIQNDSIAERLFLESVDLCDDKKVIRKYARKYAAIHPTLYQQILDHPDNMELTELIEIGDEALKEIPEDQQIRSKIALKTAEYRLLTDENKDFVKKYYLMAFEADTSAINYLRCVLNGLAQDEDRKQLHHIIERLAISMNNKNRSDLVTVYHLSYENKILDLLFLDGQFSKVINLGLNKKTALGWTGTFMKQGIAMFLLMIHEGKWTGKGICSMAERVKHEFDYSLQNYWCGLDQRLISNGTVDENELFYNIFTRWKELTPIEQELRNRVIEKIEKLIEIRTEGIMQANRRNYYGECASYIAALGEAKESLGDVGAKQRLMTSYKTKYVRRNAFRAELKTYGWKG